MTGEPVYTLMRCPCCEEAVRPSRHTPEECCESLKRQRDRARAMLRDRERQIDDWAAKAAMMADRLTRMREGNE